MLQIQAWLALPAKRRDDNCIGDIWLEVDPTDPLSPVLVGFRRPDGGGRFPTRLRRFGLDLPLLITHISEIVQIVNADAVSRATSLVGTVHDGITLTVSEVEDKEACEVARLTVTPEHGRPFKYDVAWHIKGYDFVDALTLELYPHDLRPWELLRVVCSTLLSIFRCPRVTELRYLLVRESEAGFVRA